MIASVSPTALVVFGLSWMLMVWVVAAIPAFVIGRRLGVVHAGEAFVPVVGPSIVMLHSIRRSGWMCLLQWFPYVGAVFFIWLVCVVPGAHGRTRWWILPCLIPLVNVVAFYIYAFTLPRTAASSEPGLAVTVA